jgi:hypothetical protein
MVTRRLTAAASPQGRSLAGELGGLHAGLKRIAAAGVGTRRDRFGMTDLSIGQPRFRAAVVDCRAHLGLAAAQRYGHLNARGRVEPADPGLVLEPLRPPGSHHLGIAAAAEIDDGLLAAGPFQVGDDLAHLPAEAFGPVDPEDGLRRAGHDLALADLAIAADVPDLVAPLLPVAGGVAADRDAEVRIGQGQGDVCLSVRHEYKQQGNERRNCGLRIAGSRGCPGLRLATGAQVCPLKRPILDDR